MAWEDKNLGAATAYAIARKYGYQGTEEEWARELNNASSNAQLAKESAEKAAQSENVTKNVAETVTENIATWIRNIESAGSEQTENINNAGDSAFNAITEHGETALRAIDQAGNEVDAAIRGTTDSLKTDIVNIGGEQKRGLESIGSTYVQKINGAGNVQVERVEKVASGIEEVGDEQVGRVQETSRNGINSLIESKDSSVAEIGQVKTQAIAAVGEAKDGAKSEIADREAAGVSSIIAKTDEQLERIPQVQELSEEVSWLKSDKLDKDPSLWPTWPAEEQAAARSRIGFGDFAIVADLDIEEDVNYVSITTRNYREFYVVVFVMDDAKARNGFLRCVESSTLKYQNIYYANVNANMRAFIVSHFTLMKNATDPRLDVVGESMYSSASTSSGWTKNAAWTSAQLYSTYGTNSRITTIDKIEVTVPLKAGSNIKVYAR